MPARRRGPPLTEIRQTINFTMDPELHARVAAYHKSVDPHRLAAETYRELLWSAVSGGDPLRGTLVASRIVGVNKAKAFVLSEVVQFLNDLTERMRRMAGEADANVLAEAQLAVQAVMNSVNGDRNVG